MGLGFMLEELPMRFDGFVIQARIAIAHNLVLVLVIAAVLTYWGLCWCLTVDNTRKRWNDVASEHQVTRTTLTGSTKKILLQSLPPPYPNGWYCLCFSEDLTRGQVLQIRCLGQDLALFRTASPPYTAHVIHAYCPHLGANIAVGGVVDGQCIVCPFHGWKFQGDGTCTHIPGVNPESIPALANTQAFTVSETSGMVCLWWHAGGQQPSYPPPHVPEITDRRHWRAGQTQHTVACHVAEIPENGADVAHLHTLHAPLIWKFLRPVFTHAWHATWDLDTQHKERSQVSIHESLTFFGKRLSALDVLVSGNQIGPAIVILRWSTPLGVILLCETLLPLKPMLQRVVHRVYCGPFVPRILGLFFLHAAVAQFERDVPIWSNKIYLQKPLLTSQDGPIAKFRRWYGQFYCKESVDFATAMEDEKIRSIEW